MLDILAFNTMDTEVVLKPNVHSEMSTWIMHVEADFIAGLVVFEFPAI